MPWTTLISAAALADRYQDRDWVVVDCRHDLAEPDAGARAYAAGHIPGARFAHLDTALSDKRPGPRGEFRGRHPLPEPDAFIETLRGWGIDSTSQVVAYDAHGGMFAARLWWMLRWVGHAAAAVLDGGLPSWQSLGLPLSRETVTPARGDIIARAPLAATVDAQQVLDNIARPARIVIDARAPDRFRGDNETLDPVSGHIPGARNRFFKDNLQADGRFKPADQLRRELSAIASDPQAVIAQCGSGVTACHNLLALEIAGLHGAALYPGSWSEWCSVTERPVAR